MICQRYVSPSIGSGFVHWNRTSSPTWGEPSRLVGAGTDRWGVLVTGAVAVGVGVGLSSGPRPSVSTATRTRAPITTTLASTAARVPPRRRGTGGAGSALGALEGADVGIGGGTT